MTVHAEARWRWWHFIPTLSWVTMIIRAFRGYEHNDFSIFWDGALRLREGMPLYEAGYMYPPFMAWLLVPLTFLPMLAVAALWILAKVPVFYWSARMFMPRSLSPQARRNLLILSPLLLFRFLESDMANGNSNVYLLGLVALAYGLAVGGKQVVSAWAAAAAVSVKLSPLYLMVAFWNSNRARAAVLIPVFSVVIILGSSLPVGVGDAWRGFTGTSEGVFTTEGTEKYLPGQSLRPVIHRWLRDMDATAHDGEYVSINVADLSDDTVEWMFRGLALVIALFGFLATRGRDLSWSLPFCLGLLLLISPYARKAHFVWLLPSVLIVLGHLVERGVGRRTVLAFFAIYFASGHLTARHILGRETSYLWNGAGATFLAAVAILSAMWIIRPRESVSMTEDH